VTTLREHLLAIPGMTEEMLQERADYLRGKNHTADFLRDWGTAVDLYNAAVLDAFPPPPQPVQVGHLATWGTGVEDWYVVAIDGDEVWLRAESGRRIEMPLDSVRYSRPCPEGWGQ
jgi:hypothetical protein